MCALEEKQDTKPTEQHKDHRSYSVPQRDEPRSRVLFNPLGWRDTKKHSRESGNWLWDTNYTAIRGEGLQSTVRARQAGRGRADLPKASNHSIPVRTAGEKSITQARNCNNNWHLYSIRYPGVPKHLTDITSWTDLQAGDPAPRRTSIPTWRWKTPADSAATFTHHSIEGASVRMLWPSTSCTI